MDTTHQAATLTIQVGVNLLLESRLVQVSTTNSDTKSNCLLLGVASYVLEDSNGGIDSTTLSEKSSNGSTRALRSNEDDINIGWDIDFGLVLEDWGETVGEVKSLQS